MGNFLKSISAMSLCVSLLGCLAPPTALVRHQSVPIPGYDRSDYEALLPSKDPEIQANAISNLIPQAAVYARSLKRQDAPGTAERTPSDEAPTPAEAQRVFAIISAGLRSDDDDVKAAALMFLAEAAPLCSEKKAWFASVSRVETDDVRTQYEQLNTLIALVEPDTDVDRKMLGGFLGQRSWRIRGMTYRLLGHIVCDDMHAGLLRDYRKTTRDDDKLVMLQAFRQHYGADVFEVLKEELVGSKNPRIPVIVADMLPAHRDETAVSRWVVEDHRRIDDDILRRIFDRYAEALSGARGPSFFEGLLIAPSSSLMRLLGQSTLIEHLYSQIKKAPHRTDLVALRDALQTHQPLKTQWAAYAKEQAQKEAAARAEEALRRAILPKYTERLDKFLSETQALLAEFGMSDEEIQGATREIRALLQLFRETSAE